MAEKTPESPGFDIIDVFLLDLTFKINPKAKPPESAKEVVECEIKTNFSRKVGEVEGQYAAFLTVEVDSDPLTIRMMLSGLFQEDGSRSVTKADFLSSDAPALLFPFARSIIADLTSKSPVPNLMLPVSFLSTLKKAMQSPEEGGDDESAPEKDAE